MEMEFKDTGRRRRLLLIGLGLALALAAGYGAFRLASGGGNAPAVIKEQVLVAARPIPARTTLTADDVTLREVPIDEILGESYREAEAVIGRVTSVPIYADQQMTPNLFATSAADAEFSILGPDETVSPDSPVWRAVAVRIPPDRAVGGAVESGQHVDLVVSVSIEVLTLDDQGNYIKTDTASQEGFQAGTSTKITFQDVEVLKASPDDDLYVFKVDLHQAEQISHIIQLAPDSFTMVLRPDEDTRVAETGGYGTTSDRLILTYLFPAPLLVDLNKLLNPPQPNGTTPPAGAPTPVPGSSPSPGPGVSPAPSESAEPSASPAP
jgi:Flp pilus assembly protein CpaB